MPFEHATTPMKPAPANDMAGHRIASTNDYEAATERVRELRGHIAFQSDDIHPPINDGPREG